jgi:hypothetical protein
VSQPCAIFSHLRATVNHLRTTARRREPPKTMKIMKHLKNRKKNRDIPVIQ